VRTPRAVVVDTNVVIAGLLTADSSSPTAITVDGMLGARFVFLLSEPLLAEYRTVLLRSPIRERHGLDEREVDEFLAEIVRNGIVREPPVSAESDSPAPDPKDQHLWDLVGAEAGSALVTGDLALVENPPDGARVLEPREFAAMIRG
jgi:putative PIN family toxin of toxin-antitoxin system